MTENKNNVIGLIGAYAVALGLTVGGGMWATPTVVSSMVGPLVLLFPVLTVLVMLTMFPTYFTMAKLWPTSAAHYRYPAKLLLPENETIGQLIGWTHIWSYIAVVAVVGFHLMVAAPGEFLAAMIGSLSYEMIVSILLILGFLIVWFGIRAVGVAEIVLSAALLFAILVVLVPGLSHIEVANLTMQPPSNIGLGIAAFAMIYGIAIPSILMVDLGDDIIDAESSLPKSLIVGVLGNSGIAFLMAVISVGVVSYTDLTGNTIAIVVQQYLPANLTLIVTIGALLAGFSSLIGLITIVSRYMNAAATDGILPQWTSELNKHGEPKYLLGFQALVAIPTVFLDLPLRTIIGAATLTYLAGATLVLLVGIRLPSRYPGVFERDALKSSFVHKPEVVRFTAAIGLLVNLCAFGYLALSDITAFTIWFVLVVLGIVIFVARTMQSESQIRFTNSPDIELLDAD